jgi:Ribose 5-phosphate isomerase A (phosphoriboisomerase A)
MPLDNLLLFNSTHPIVAKTLMTQAMTQDELKTLVGQAAMAYVQPGSIVGVGTGSTVNKFIDALGAMAGQIKGAVSSSVASTERLQALGITVFDATEVDELAVYIDGADEIDHAGCMIKGGGAALTREKIVAAQARQFVCIADGVGRFSATGRGDPHGGQTYFSAVCRHGWCGYVANESGRAARYRQRSAHTGRDGFKNR